MYQPRIILADDSPSVLRGIVPILEAEFEVVATASNGRELVEQAVRLSPDLVVTDIAMPVLDGIAAARQILKAVPDVKVVFLTIHRDPAVFDEAWSMGASGYVLKTTADEDLVTAVREALAGRQFCSTDLGVDGMRPPMNEVSGQMRTDTRRRQTGNKRREERNGIDGDE